MLRRRKVLLRFSGEAKEFADFSVEASNVAEVFV